MTNWFIDEKENLISSLSSLNFTIQLLRWTTQFCKLLFQNTAQKKTLFSSGESFNCHESGLYNANTCLGYYKGTFLQNLH